MNIKIFRVSLLVLLFLFVVTPHSAQFVLAYQQSSALLLIC